MSTLPASSRQFTYAFAKDKGLIVLPDRDTLTVGVRMGADAFWLVEARRALGCSHAIESMDAASFDRALTTAFSQGPLGATDIEAAVASRGGLESLIDDIPEAADLLGGSDDAPVIRLINGLIYEAMKRRASDIHIDPFEDKLSIRYRIDGDLVEVITPPRKLAAPLVSRIKVMARLDIAEKRLPQDGRISLQAGGRSIDVRVAILPTRFGERVALRLLDTQNALLTLEELGMDSDTYQRFDQVLSQPNGVILVTGPVGSGKTTTLYSSISRLNTGNVNIMTLEDPVEYGLPGISQTQMDSKVGLTFARALRNILRQDFNIVMVGEIRDLETAEAAFEFASTGRLAFSTLHTNSAAGAITRLRDMGVETYLMASTLRAVMAQRLVRKLCDVCKEPAEAGTAEYEALDLPHGQAFTHYTPKGCMACGNTGFHGRIAIYELLVIDNAVRNLLHADATEDAIEAVAFADHHRLIENARRYVFSGETSVTEVLRVCRKEARDGSV
jgi:general secretion pathway protein E|tara:strand:- start:97236 stop:98738 length:1503 start_codon:yes stop_codon:yes gene_type:complete